MCYIVIIVFNEVVEILLLCIDVLFFVYGYKVGKLYKIRINVLYCVRIWERDCYDYVVLKLIEWFFFC